MNRLLSLLLAAILCATASAQTIKTLGFNTNGHVVANTGTNVLTFTNQVAFSASDITTYGSGLTSFGVSLNFEERRVQDVSIANDVFNWGSGEYVELGLPIAFVSTNNAATTTRANLGFSTNLNTLWTATNASNARSAVGLGATNNVSFASVNYDGELTVNNAQIVGWASTIDFEESRWNYSGYGSVDIFNWGTSNKLIVGLPIEFNNTTNAATTRTNLGLPLATLTNTSNVTMMRALAGSTNASHPFSGSISVTGTNNTNTLVFSNGILQSVQ